VRHPVQSSFIYRFGAFEADPENRELRKHGTRVRLQEKPFQVLIELLLRPGEVVTRDELRHRLWAPGTFVDFDEGVNTAVKRLRSCLGDSAENPVYIETLSRYGYRFIAPVSAFTGADNPVQQQEPGPELVVIRRGLKAGEVERKKVLGKPSWGKISLIAAAIVLAGVAVYKIRYPGPPAVAMQSLAVLPLQNLSGEASQEYFADGITDEITTELAKLAGPMVISRTSAMQYKGTHKTVPQIARELNVEAIVEGSVERSAQRVRVRVQLIQAATDRHLWAEKYDREVTDVLQLEADVAEDIARQIQTQLNERQRQQLAGTRPVNPQAFQDYLLGRHYWALRTKESLSQAVEYFDRAIQEDPSDGRSYAGLAHCYIVMPMLTGLPQAEALEKARETASKALAIDESLPEAHLAVAESLLYHDWNFGDAEKEFVRTLQLNPNYSTAHQWYAEFLGLMGRHDQAIREVRQALSLDPLSAIVHHQAANILRNAGRDDEAIAEYKEALKISPAFYMSSGEMALALSREGRIAEAIQAMRQSVAGYVKDWGEDPALARAIDELPAAYATGGRERYLRQVLKTHSYCTRPHYLMARDHAELGDREAAITELNRAFQTHEMELLSILSDPELDPLRSDPRFQRLIRAIGFPG
jgi:TolB-like protein/DNA-binding winged helix-turn-helix (wHTH) protein/Tfp pilus assembly protein PilF